MKVQLINWIVDALGLLQLNLDWMAWNLFLALIPFGLSILLFRKSRSVSIWWWILFLTFIAFLPNAPYVLTDIIHLIYDIRNNYSVWQITLILIPEYLLFMLIGFQAYVLSLINLGYFLNQHQKTKFILPAELFIHTLSAIGIYLGRFKRFNSWDIVTKIDSLANTVLDDLVGKWPVLVIAITFVIIAGLYWLMKRVTLAIAAYQKNPQPEALIDSL